MERKRSCCFTGHRPDHLPWGRQEEDLLCRRTREALAVAIEYAYQDGYRWFYTGMALGIDQIAAELVIHSKRFHPDIHLVAAIPCPGQAQGWRMEDIQRYCDILDECDLEDIHILAPARTRRCMLDRDRYMVDHSGRLIAVYDGKSRGGTEYTLGYALMQGLEVVTIDPNNPQMPETLQSVHTSWD